ncbi:DUF2812 domain-containing protein [Streptococcus suis]|nr:DUF2812 domain-containing protein [Streptococcus suis]
MIGNPSLNHRYRKGFYSLFKTLQQNRWEFVVSCQNFNIFRKPAKMGELELYGDRENKVEFVKTIFQRRYLPSLGLYGILLGTSLRSRPGFVLGISIIYIPLLLLLGIRFYRMVKE